MNTFRTIIKRIGILIILSSCKAPWDSKKQENNDMYPKELENFEKNLSKDYSIGIGTFYTKNIRHYGDLSYNILENYANRHGYGTFVEHTPLVTEQYTPHWNKYPFISKYLEKDNYDYIVWNDADAAIQYPEQRIEKFIDEKYEVIVSSDMWQKHQGNMNTGVIIVKNTDWTKKLFKHLMEDPRCEKYKKVSFHDQTCLEIQYKNNWKNAREKIKIIPHLGFQGPSDKNFIRHFAGNKSGIIEVFEEILERSEE